MKPRKSWGMNHSKDLLSVCNIAMQSCCDVYLREYRPS